MVSYPYDLTLINPGAETGDMTGWSSIYLDIGQAQASGSDVPSHSGSYYFDGAGNNLFAWWGQVVQLPTEVLADVDAGTLAAQGSVWAQGYSGDADNGGLWLESFDAQNNLLSSWGGAYIDPSDWIQQVGVVNVPPGTRSVRISVKCIRVAGSQISIYFDDFALSLVTADTGAAKQEMAIVQVAGNPITNAKSEEIIAQIATQSITKVKIEEQVVQVASQQAYRPLLIPGRRRGGNIVY